MHQLFSRVPAYMLQSYTNLSMRICDVSNSLLVTFSVNVRYALHHRVSLAMYNISAHVANPNCCMFCMMHTAPVQVVFCLCALRGLTDGIKERMEE